METQTPTDPRNLLRNISSLRVAELKAHLQARCLSSTGRKAVLVERLLHKLQNEIAILDNGGQATTGRAGTGTGTGTGSGAAAAAVRFNPYSRYNKPPPTSTSSSTYPATSANPGTVRPAGNTQPAQGGFYDPKTNIWTTIPLPVTGRQIPCPSCRKQLEVPAVVMPGGRFLCASCQKTLQLPLARATFTNPLNIPSNAMNPAAVTPEEAASFQRLMQIQETKDMDRAMDLSRAEHEVYRRSQHQRETQQQHASEVFSNQAFVRSDILKKCKHVTRFREWVETDGKKTILAILRLEKRSQKWFPLSHHYFTTVGCEIVTMDTSLYKEKMDNVLKELNRELLLDPDKSAAPKIFRDAVPEGGSLKRTDDDDLAIVGQITVLPTTTTTEIVILD